MWQYCCQNKFRQLSCQEFIKRCLLFCLTSRESYIWFRQCIIFEKKENFFTLTQKNGVEDGQVDKIVNVWYVPHYTPSELHQDLLSVYIVSNFITELSDIKRSVISKSVQQQPEWQYDLEFEIGTDIPF